MLTTDFLCIPTNKVDQVVLRLNDFHANVEFTVELEDDPTKSMNFLDTSVYNNNGKIITKWWADGIEQTYQLLLCPSKEDDPQHGSIFCQENAPSQL